MFAKILENKGGILKLGGILMNNWTDPSSNLLGTISCVENRINRFLLQTVSLWLLPGTLITEVLGAEAELHIGAWGARGKRKLSGAATEVMDCDNMFLKVSFWILIWVLYFI